MTGRPRRPAALAPGLGLVLASCTPAQVERDSEPAPLPPGHVPALPAPPPAAPPPPPLAEDDPLVALLDPLAVLPDRPPPRVLYTWTTRDQIEAIAGDRALLRRSRAVTGEPSRFDRHLAALGDAAPPAVRRLRGPGCDRRRFAWPNPWATVMGWPDERYGDQLVEVVLRPDAVVAVADDRLRRWSYVDLAGRALDPAEAELRGVGVVLHLADPADDPAGTIAGADPADTIAAADPVAAALPYRELVICDEAAVERWSYGTPAILRRITADVALLRELARAADPAGPAPRLRGDLRPSLARALWRGERPPQSLLDRYLAALAWPTADYRPDPARLRRIAEVMQQALDAQLGALDHRVTGRPTPPPEPRLRRRPPRPGRGGTL